MSLPASMARVQAQRWARVGVLAALAMVLGYIEVFIPLPVPVPGIKLGLANIVVLVALTMLDVRSAALVATIKVLATGLLFGNPLMMLYSAGGTVLAFVAMALLSRLPGLHVVLTSIVGAVLHNVGQLGVASLVLGTPLVWATLPILVIAAVVTGMLSGMAAHYTLACLQGKPLRENGDERGHAPFTPEGADAQAMHQARTACVRQGGRRLDGGGQSSPAGSGIQQAASGQSSPAGSGMQPAASGQSPAGSGRQPAGGGQPSPAGHDGARGAKSDALGGASSHGCLTARTRMAPSAQVSPKTGGLRNRVRSADARLLLAALVIFCVATLHVRTIAGLAVCLALALMCAGVAGLSVQDARRALVPLAPIVAITVVMQVFVYQEGTVLVAIGPLSVTNAGCMQALRMVASLVAVVVANVAFMRVVATESLVDTFAWICKPLAKLGANVDAFVLSLSVAFAFVPVLVKEFGRLKQAHQSRLASFDGSLKDRLNAYMRLFAPLARSSFRHADSLADALLSRCM